jgi:hypothetical protein
MYTLLNKKETIKLIENYHDTASDLAIKLIESEARQILERDDGLDEFVMAMGSCFFTYKEGGKYDLFSYPDDMPDEQFDALPQASDGIIHDDNFQTEFMEMVDDLNDKFNICGHPMRFRKRGETVNNW